MGHSINYEARTFTCGHSGVVFQLRPVSEMAMMKLKTDIDRRKPKVPVVETPIGPGGQTHLEANPFDPEYQAALDAHQRDEGQALLQYQFVMGIANDPPPEVVRRLVNIWPDWSGADIKYMWISESLGNDTADVTALIEAIMAQTMVTQEGLAQSEAAFRDNSEWQPDPDMAVRTSVSAD